MKLYFSALEQLLLPRRNLPDARSSADGTILAEQKKQHCQKVSFLSCLATLSFRGVTLLKNSRLEVLNFR